MYLEVANTVLQRSTGHNLGSLVGTGKDALSGTHLRDSERSYASKSLDRKSGSSQIPRFLNNH